MKRALIVAVLVAIALAVCVKYLYDRNTTARLRADSLATVLDSLSDEAAGLQARNTALAAALDTQMTAMSRQKEAEIEQLKDTYDELVKDMQSEIAQGQIQITRLADRLSVSLVDRILFPSGEADITPEGIKILDRVGKVLKNTERKSIQVEGHTDNVAISERLKGKFPTNWELSSTRATNVVRFLQDTVGIDPTRLRAVGLSEYHPIANNATARGRSQNRRIEIGLLPEVPGTER
ncbi:MAG TPA: OmpA family protein [Gemmatimonadales bacterium]|jgi:chemotaxis protein MotB